MAWIQTGTVQENILFGSVMDKQRYQKTLEKCSLVKDLEMLPFGDLTVIGERGVNVSGGQKQHIQLARALYQDADIYLLDDPFSVVDAHTATSLFNEYVMGALLEKTVLLVTHQVDFLPVFDSVLEAYKTGLTEKYGSEIESQPSFDATIWVEAAGSVSKNKVYGFGPHAHSSNVLDRGNVSGDFLTAREEYS